MTDDRQISPGVLVKIGVGLILLLFVFNSVFLYLFVRGEARNRELARVVTETNEKFNKVLVLLNQKAPGETRAALTETERKALTEALKVAPAEPPLAEKKAAPVEEAKKITPPLERVVTVEIPANSTPQPLVAADPGEFAVVVEKDTKSLRVFRYANGAFSPAKSFPCIIGANNGDKRKAGDYATPKGAYFTVRYTPGNRLPEEYGAGAFILNYPNLIDRKEGKNGHGIWIHGHDSKKPLNELLNTKGCIVVTNDVLKELSTMIRPNGTPVVIVDRLKFGSQGSGQASSEELKTFVNSWRHAWESINTKKYLSFYAPDFVNSDGMNYESFRRYKERVNQNKKAIQVKVEKTAVLLPQDHEGNIAVIRFDQKYQSNNFKSESKKLLYLRKGTHGWQIIGESVF